jgi:hypothetical protein
MTSEAIYDDDVLDAVTYLHDAAFDAWRWLHENDIAPSQMWTDIMESIAAHP